MRISYENMADRYTILGASTAATGYPVANVQDIRIVQKYRTVTVSSVIITIDLGYYSDSSMVVALVGHNFTSSVSVIADFNYINSFPGATSQTISYNAGMLLKFFDHETPEKLTTEVPEYLTTEDGYYLTTEYNYRYMQLQITDSANTNGYLEIGRIWLGNYIQIDPSSLLDFKVTKKRSDIVIYGKDRQKWGIKGEGWRRFELSFPPSEEAMITKIENMFDYVGNYKPLIFCNFDTIRGYTLVEPCYCSIDGDIGFTHTHRMKMNYNLSLEEDL